MRSLKLYCLLWFLIFLFILVALFLQHADLNSYGQAGARLLEIIISLKSDWVFSDKNRLDLWSTAVLIYLPVWAWQVKEKSQIIVYSWFLVFGLLGIIFLESGLYSRIAFSFGIIPLIGEMLVSANRFRKEKSISLFDIRVILYIALGLVIALPGFYFPPFYDGIAGWTVKSEEINLDEIIFARLEVTDRAGNIAPFPYPCFAPITMEGRMLRSLNFGNKNPFVSKIPKGEFEEKRAQFFIESYQRCLIFLRQGKYPYQWILGEYAYPTHNLSKKPNKSLYKKIDENHLVKVEWVVYNNTRSEAKDFKTIREVKETYALTFQE